LLLPREPSKALTGLIGAEPLVQAQAAEVQRRQFSYPRPAWDAEAVNAGAWGLLAEEPATAPSVYGVLVVDDTGFTGRVCLTVSQSLGPRKRRGAWIKKTL